MSAWEWILYSDQPGAQQKARDCITQGQEAQFTGQPLVPTSQLFRQEGIWIEQETSGDKKIVTQSLSHPLESLEGSLVLVVFRVALSKGFIKIIIEWSSLTPC